MGRMVASQSPSYKAPATNWKAFRPGLLESPQTCSLRLPHLVEEPLDLFERTYGRGERVHLQRVERLVSIPLEERLHDQLVHSHVGSVQTRQLLGKRAETDRMETVGIDPALHLDATVRQVRDRAVIHHVAMNARITATFDCLDDVGGIFEAALKRNLCLAAQHRLNARVIFLAPRGPVVGVEAALAEIAGPGVLLDQNEKLAVVR